MAQALQFLGMDDGHILSTHWICSCGFHNRQSNSVCGGSGPLGCKASRNAVGAPCESLEADGTSETDDIPTRCEGTLRLLTYNVWFSSSEQELRMTGIARILESVDADVIALQEVTIPILKLLTSFISREWQVFKQEPTHVEDLHFFEVNYFTCLLVRRSLPVIKAACFRFSITAMARGLQFVVLSLGPECADFAAKDGRCKVIIATSHLESPVASRSGQDTRFHQLREGYGSGANSVWEFVCCLVSIDDLQFNTLPFPPDQRFEFSNSSREGHDLMTFAMAVQEELLGHFGIVVIDRMNREALTFRAP